MRQFHSNEIRQPEKLSRNEARPRDEPVAGQRIYPPELIYPQNLCGNLAFRIQSTSMNGRQLVLLLLCELCQRV